MKTRIRELRRERKLSQEELAEAVGTTRQTITSIEVANIPPRCPLHTRSPGFSGSLSRKYSIFPNWRTEQWINTGKNCVSICTLTSPPW